MARKDNNACHSEWIQRKHHLKMFTQNHQLKPILTMTTPVKKTTRKKPAAKKRSQAPKGSLESIATKASGIVNACLDLYEEIVPFFTDPKKKVRKP